MSSENTFGQNSWLVDEMFQQYKEDPDSVDAEWRKLFGEKGAPKTAKGTPTVTPSMLLLRTLSMMPTLAR